jgi:hypothetical protein
MVGTRERRRAWLACAIGAVALVALCASPIASALRETPGRTHINDNRGRFVHIPRSVPHVPGAYIDKRIRRNLIWLANHFRIYVVEGFAGRLPNGDKVGCPQCHVSHSEHKIGLAVDIVPLHNDGTGKCNKRWKSVSKLAKWAEPRQNQPLPPFRWVGYDGDEDHGCGNHLHLSWNHDDRYEKYKPSRWVEVFKVRRRTDETQNSPLNPVASKTQPPSTAPLDRFEYEPSR